MKTVRILAAMFVAVLSLGFVACSDDDDDDDKKEAKVNYEELVFSNLDGVKAKLGEPTEADIDGGYAMYTYGEENKHINTAMFLFEGEENNITTMSLYLKPEVKAESVKKYLGDKYYLQELGTSVYYTDAEDLFESDLWISYTEEDAFFGGISLMYMNMKDDATAKSRKSVEEINAFVKEHTYKFF